MPSISLSFGRGIRPAYTPCAFGLPYRFQVLPQPLKNGCPGEHLGRRTVQKNDVLIRQWPNQRDKSSVFISKHYPVSIPVKNDPDITVFSLPIVAAVLCFPEPKGWGWLGKRPWCFIYVKMVSFPNSFYKQSGHTVDTSIPTLSFSISARKSGQIFKIFCVRSNGITLPLFRNQRFFMQDTILQEIKSVVIPYGHGIASGHF